MKTFSRIILTTLVPVLLVSPLRAAKPVRHRFLVVDNSAHRLILVDQHEPSRGGWAPQGACGIVRGGTFKRSPLGRSLWVLLVTR